MTGPGAGHDARANGAVPAGTSESIVQLGLWLAARGSRTNNAIVSPYGLAATLSLMAVGAGDRTRSRVEAATGVAVLGDHGGRVSLATLDRALTGAARSAGVELALANGVWFDRRLQLRPDYSDLLRHATGITPTTTLDLRSPNDIDAINAWVSQASGGQVRDLVQPPNPDWPILKLACNVLRFRGDWALPFEVEDTTPAAFNRPRGRTRDVHLMSLTAWWDYRESSHLQAVILPYRGGTPEEGGFDMILILPRSADLDPLALRDADSASELTDALLGRGFHRRGGTVYLPRLTLRSATTLFESRPHRTQTSAVTGPDVVASAIAGLSTQPRMIARQQIVLDVDESGTTAASAIEMVLFGLASTPRSQPPPFEFRADRPFWLALRESRSGTILVLGVIRAP